ncbi:hypothetical protein TREES_T100003930 [Tupaia chinensis]|uniref:Uncharacterized protein n=1 Tax=Tupaia chinensis TaxID=246437 RepID=L9KZD0_TUPCH|nr:hypothetical protein TREES_T100003930 [Tupaia chinensis]
MAESQKTTSPGKRGFVGHTRGGTIPLLGKQLCHQPIPEPHSQANDRFLVVKVSPELREVMRTTVEGSVGRGNAPLAVCFDKVEGGGKGRRLCTGHPHTEPVPQPTFHGNCANTELATLQLGLLSTGSCV